MFRIFMHLNDELINEEKTNIKPTIYIQISNN